MAFGKWRFARLVLAMSAACGGGGDDTAATPAAASPTPSKTSSIQFDDDSTLMLVPGAVVDISARVVPADGRSVRFALLDEPSDSSLSPFEVATDGDGVARTQLRAASRAVTFRLRATSGTNSAERTVAVGGAGFATIHVVPKYAGKRSVTGWTATAATSGRCSDHATAIHPDGPLPADANLTIIGVPIGPRAVVTLRSAHAIGGCAEVDDLSLGEVRQLTIVTLDAPQRVSPLRALVRLEGAKGPPPMLIQSWGTRFRDALLGGASSPWSGLLDAVATALPASKAPVFLAARKAGAWDAIAQELSPAAAAELDTWVEAGIAAMANGLSVEGEVLSGEANGYALFTPTKMGGAMLDPSSSPPRVASWVALPDDIAKLSSELTAPPSRFVAAAIESVSAGGSGAGALETSLACAGLSKKLAALSTFGCDSACFLSACKAATATMWQRAMRGDELSGQLATVTASAAFAVTVDKEALVTGGAGTGTISIKIQGTDWQTDATSTLTPLPSP